MEGQVLHLLTQVASIQLQVRMYAGHGQKALCDSTNICGMQ